MTFNFNKLSRQYAALPPEFLKIKERQKAFGVNNGLRVHEVCISHLSRNEYIMICFWSAWGLRQGCDGGHPRHVGKHAVGFKVTLKMASFDELLQSTSFTLFVCFRLLGLSFGCRLSLPWPNRRIRVIAPYSQPLKGYVSRLLRISGIACCKQIHFREDGRGRKYADNSL